MLVRSIPHKYHASAEGANLAANESFRKGDHSEHESVGGKKGRVIRATGELLIDSIATKNAAGVPIGATLLVVPINVTAFGDRIQELAKDFDENRIVHLEIKYTSVCAATNNGGIAMFARNDTSAPLYHTGVDMLAHAETHKPSYADGPVWENFSMPVRPDDVMVKYFDNTDGSARMTMQGVIQVLSASALAGNFAFGNLSMKYDIEFYGEDLSFDASEIASGIAHMKLSSTVIPLADYAAGTLFQANSYALDPGTAGEVRLIGLSALGFTPDDIIYGVVVDEVGGNAVVGPKITPSDISPLTIGMAFVAVPVLLVGGTASLDDGSVGYFFFWDFDNALSGNNPGECWSFGSSYDGVRNTDYSVYLRSLPTID
jgi:hypothetical protein